MLAVNNLQEVRGITSSTLVQCTVIMQTEVKVQKDDNDQFHIDDSL